MRLKRAALVLIAGAGIASLAFGATLRSIDVYKTKGRYSLIAETFLDARPIDIYEVLLDYENFNRISSVYKEHGYLEPAPDGTPIIFTRMEGCLLFYCLDMTRVERLETDEPGYIKTVTLPERSDFKYSVSEWQLEPEATGTRMIYKLEMEPDFWVPPIIGPIVIRRVLRSGGERAITRIERLARGEINEYVH